MTILSLLEIILQVSVILFMFQIMVKTLSVNLIIIKKNKKNGSNNALKFSQTVLLIAII